MLKKIAVAAALAGCGMATAQAPVSLYVSKNGTDGNDGRSPATAVATVGRALALAATQPLAEVLVAAGTYDEGALAMKGDLSLSGGWDTTFSPASRKLLTPAAIAHPVWQPELCKEHTCITTTRGDRVITISGSVPSGRASLSQLLVLGPDRTTALNSNSFGVVVDGVSPRVESIIIRAGVGGTGGTGQAPPRNTRLCVNGGNGGFTIYKGDAFSGTCTGGQGDPGGTVTPTGAPAIAGGRGGNHGYSDCMSQSRDSDAANGDPGYRGGDGLEGSFGRAAPADKGTMARINGALQWGGKIGNPGGSGSAGSGGGGGGAGGTWVYLYWCLGGYPVVGGHGATGGSGGCGGEGAGAGHPGGTAAAMVVFNGRVQAENIALLGGAGGKGGDGGDGAPGAAGGGPIQNMSAGGATKGCFEWGPERHAGTGGPGGPGGNGGGGGGGAGGNGGPAFNLIEINEGGLFATGVRNISGGVAGKGGAAGKGANGVNTADPGNPGEHGAVVQFKVPEVSPALAP